MFRFMNTRSQHISRVVKIMKLIIKLCVLVVLKGNYETFTENKLYILRKYL